MTNTRKLQLQTEVDASGAKAGFDQVKQGARDMAREVGAAGAQAGQGFDKGLGEGASRGGAKVDRATKDIIASIERATAAANAGGRNTAAYFEQIAQQRGISGAAIAPYLAELKEAERAQQAATVGLGNMGMSARQTAAALRQVPAQFTDIVTSLQGGQAPLTVLLQQGGQLRDVFGSSGAAVKALGGFVVGLITPFTLLAAAGVAVGAGFLAGAKEAQELNRALVLTGNQAGLNVGQLTAMAERLDAVAGTQGRATEVLVAFAQSGRVGAEGIERFTKAAIDMERAGGPAAEETVKAFADLGREPLQAALKLNEATGFLTKGVYEQIKALTDQGRETDAARVAQEAYASALEGRAPQLEAQLGLLERGWRGVADATREAWDALKNVGRVDNTLEAAIRRTQERAYTAEFLGDDESLRAAEQLLARLRESLKLQEDVGRAQAEQARQAQAKADWDKQGEAFLGRSAKLEREIAQARALGARAGETEIEIASRVADIRERARDKSSDKSEASRLANEREAEARALERLVGLSGSFARDSEQLRQLREKALLTEQQFVKAYTDLARQQPVNIALAREEEVAQRAKLKAFDDLMRSEERRIEVLNRGAEGVASQVQRLRDEEQALGLTASGHLSLAQAIEKVAIARLEETQAKLTAGGDYAAAGALREEITQREKLIALIGGQDLRKAANDSSRELDQLLDPARAESFGDALSRAFDGAGNGLARLSNALQSYARQQAQIARTQALADKEADPAKRLRAQLKINEDAQRSTIGLYANMAGAAKGFFDEGSKGYKALEAAETAWRAYQLASDLVKGASAAAVAVANQAQGDPYTAWARMAAMAAAMAALGFAVTGGLARGGGGGGDGAPVNSGTGTVFGDAGAQSQSVARSTEQLADTARLQLSTQSGMLQALRSIESGIGGLGNLVLRGNALSGGPGAQFGIASGVNTSDGLSKAFLTAGGIGAASYFLDTKLFGGKFTNALFGTKTNITGTGLTAAGQTLGNIVDGGLDLQEYLDVNVQRKFAGIRVSNRNSTQYGAADPVLEQQFGQVLKNFYEAIELAAGPLDFALNGVRQRLDAFVVNIGKVDLRGLNGEQIAERLSAVLGAVGDQIAAGAIPGLEDFQRVGEGYFETLVRVASGIETADDLLSRLGVQAVDYADILRKQGDVAAEVVRQSLLGVEALGSGLSSVGVLIRDLDAGAEDLAGAYRTLTELRSTLQVIGASSQALTASLLQGAGGVEALQSALDAYLQGYFTDQERAAASMAAVARDFARIGINALPRTREQYRALVESIDDTTEAGQKFLGQVLGLAGAFDEAASASEAAGDTIRRSLAGYINEFYGRDEIAAVKAGDVRQALLAAGVTADLSSREDFRALVEGIDRNSVSGLQQIEQLLALSSSFADVADYLEETGQTLSQAAASAPAVSELAPLLTNGTSQQVGAINEVRDGVYELVNLVRSNSRTAAFIREPDVRATVPRLPEVGLAA
jgi:phage-related minor tail protein